MGISQGLPRLRFASQTARSSHSVLRCRCVVLVDLEVEEWRKGSYAVVNPQATGISLLSGLLSLGSEQCRRRIYRNPLRSIRILCSHPCENWKPVFPVSGFRI